MKPVYIMAPSIEGTVTPIKCKTRRIKRARRREVPQEYRKNSIAKIKAALQEILWYFR